MFTREYLITFFALRDGAVAFGSSMLPATIYLQYSFLITPSGMHQAESDHVSVFREDNTLLVLC